MKNNRPPSYLIQNLAEGGSALFLSKEETANFLLLLDKALNDPSLDRKTFKEWLTLRKSLAKTNKNN